MSTQINVSDAGSRTENRPRKFYDITFTNSNQPQHSTDNKSSLLAYIDNSVIGKDKELLGPHGFRKVVYCDYTASGRSLSFIEDYIREEVLPDYGNTHTTSTVTSLQSTLYRHEARDIIRNAVNASEHDAVIFVGSGTTGAVHKLIHALDFKAPPVVFVSPFEHHSNLLPWRDLGAIVVRVAETAGGEVDLADLHEKIQSHLASGRQLIGCFSAASNITGTLTPVDQLAAVMHQYGGLAFFDYATAAPYVDIDMNPVAAKNTSTTSISTALHKDAVFFSTHKFVGGVQTPGVLVVKKKLLRNSLPSGSGGGSVFFVRRDSHRYLQEAEMREEGGTPAIVEAIRAGMVMQLKQAVGAQTIMDRERRLARRCFSRWQNTEGLVLLGSQQAERLPIFSFMIQHAPSSLYLHYNYVAALLNDLFGIQARGGCACAGPYAQDLLGIDEKLAQEIESVLAEDDRLDRVHLRRYKEYSSREILRPGFVRLNLPYFMDDATVDFVLEAVKLVAKDGWRLLPMYTFNPETGEWRHRKHQVFKDRKWLGHISYASGTMQYTGPAIPASTTPAPKDYQECLNQAKEILAKTQSLHIGDQRALFDDSCAHLRWFLLPSEAYQYMHAAKSRGSAVYTTSTQPPFVAATYPLANARQDKKNTSDGEGLEKEERMGEEYIEGLEDMLTGGYVCETAENGGVKCEDATSSGKVEEVPIGDDRMLSNGEATREERNADATREERNADATREEGNADATREEHNADATHEERNADATGEARNADATREERNADATREDSNADATREERIAEATREETTDTVSTNERNVKSCTNATSHADSVCTTDADRAGSSVVVQLGKGTIVADSDSISASKSNDMSKDVIHVTQDTVKISREVPYRSGKDAQVNAANDTQLTSDNAIPSTTADEASCSTDTPAVDVCQLTAGGSDMLCPIAKPRSADSKIPVLSTQLGVIHEWHHPPKHIMTATRQAIDDFSMIRDGDRVLVCLSGGKDSLSLLHTLKQFQYFSLKRKHKVHFDLGAITIDPGTEAYDPRPLIPYLAALGVPYFYEEQEILKTAMSLEECRSICSFCSRMKRGRIYTAARREGYNVLAMGQHLDDMAESFLMSVFHNGVLRTMKASYTINKEDLRVIRPFAYVREKDLRQFAEEKHLPVIPENCPACFEAPKERHRMKQLLAGQEVMFPRLFYSLCSALKPLMSIDRTSANVKSIFEFHKKHIDKFTEEYKNEKPEKPEKPDDS